MRQHERISVSTAEPSAVSLHVPQALRLALGSVGGGFLAVRTGIRRLAQTSRLPPSTVSTVPVAQGAVRQYR
jgi:hypothetical protein